MTRLYVLKILIRHNPAWSRAPPSNVNGLTWPSTDHQHWEFKCCHCPNIIFLYPQLSKLFIAKSKMHGSHVSVWPVGVLWYMLLGFKWPISFPVLYHGQLRRPGTVKLIPERFNYMLRDPRIVRRIFPEYPWAFCKPWVIFLIFLQLDYIVAIVKYTSWSMTVFNNAWFMNALRILLVQELWPSGSWSLSWILALWKCSEGVGNSGRGSKALGSSSEIFGRKIYWDL